MRPMTIKEIATAVVKHARIGLTQLRSFEESQEYAERTITDHLPNSWIDFHKNCTAIRDERDEDLAGLREAHRAVVRSYEDLGREHQAALTYIGQLKDAVAALAAENQHYRHHAGPHVPLYNPVVHREPA